MKSHWEKVYQRNREDQLGWYEEVPEPSLNLIAECHLEKDSNILIVGAGASTLIDELLARGYSGLLANDISTAALEKLSHRLGKDRSQQVQWIADDVIYPTVLNDLGKIDLWHDRAVLHFFTDQREQHAYFMLLKRLVRAGGYVIIATFSLDGAARCSGLPVHRYDAAMLKTRLGDLFELLTFYHFTHHMPDGQERKYIYTLWRRSSTWPEGQDPLRTFS